MQHYYRLYCISVTRSPKGPLGSYTRLLYSLQTGSSRLIKLTSGGIHPVFMVFMIEHIICRWKKINKYRWMNDRKERNIRGSSELALHFEADYSRVPSSVDRWVHWINPVLAWDPGSLNVFIQNREPTEEKAYNPILVSLNNSWRDIDGNVLCNIK